MQAKLKYSKKQKSYWKITQNFAALSGLFWLKSFVRECIGFLIAQQKSTQVFEVEFENQIDFAISANDMFLTFWKTIRKFESFLFFAWHLSFISSDVDYMSELTVDLLN